MITILLKPEDFLWYFNVTFGYNKWFCSSMREILSGNFMLQHCIESRISNAIVGVDTDDLAKFNIKHHSIQWPDNITGWYEYDYELIQINYSWIVNEIRSLSLWQIMVERSENLQSSQLYIWSHYLSSQISSLFSQRGIRQVQGTVQVVTVEQLTCWISVHNLDLFVYPFHEVFIFKRQSFIHQGN